MVQSFGGALLIAVGVGIAFAIMFTLGELFFRRLAGRLDSRLHAGWRWLALPLTAAISFGLFLALRPLVLDQPPSVPVMLGGVVAVALLAASATAIAAAVLRLLGMITRN